MALAELAGGERKTKLAEVMAVLVVAESTTTESKDKDEETVAEAITAVPAKYPRTSDVVKRLNFLRFPSEMSQFYFTSQAKNLSVLLS